MATKATQHSSSTYLLVSYTDNTALIVEMKSNALRPNNIYIHPHIYSSLRLSRISLILVRAFKRLLSGSGRTDPSCSSLFHPI